MAANRAAEQLLGPLPRHVDDLILDPPLRPGEVHRISAARTELQLRVAEARSADHRRHLVLLQPDDAGGLPQGDWEAIESLPVRSLRISPEGVILAANRPARSLLRQPIEGDTRLSDLLEGLGRR